MDVVLLLARLVLAGVFLVAGIAKLADLPGSRQAVRDFGVPEPLSAPLGTLLPLGESVVALALLISPFAWWGALGALALLLVFVAGIAYNLSRGRQPECHCFGQLHSEPVGWPTLIRNLVLSAVAAFVIAFGRAAPSPDVLNWWGALSTAERIGIVAGVVLLTLVVGEGWVILQMMTQHGRVLLRLEALEAHLAGGAPPSAAPSATTKVAGLPVGTSAPAFALPTLAGETMTLQALRALGKPVMLIFTDPGCGPCKALMPDVGQWQREHATKLVVALISRGTTEANRDKATEHKLTHILLQQDREIAQAYQAAGTPSAVLIGRDGTIASLLAQGADAIRTLLTTALSPAIQNPAPAPRMPVGPKVGEPAPEFSLPDLASETVSLADFRGERTLVLFWRPSCGFCQRMLPDLQAWEAEEHPDAPRLLVISTDSVEANHKMGLRAPVLLDPDGMGIGRRFGATGTPMGVLVDAEGKIASELAVGAQAVFALAGEGQPVNVPA